MYGQVFQMQSLKSMSDCICSTLKFNVFHGFNIALTRALYIYIHYSTFTISILFRNALIFSLIFYEC